MENILTEIRKQLKDNSDKKTQEGAQRFFKETVKCYGVKTPLVNNIGKKYYKTLSKHSKAEIFELCDNLWQSGYLEESFIACNWSYRLHKDFKPGDFVFFEKWVKNYVNNWASCDTL